MGTGHFQGDVVAGKYRLEREIAQGGMGQVWAAHHVELETPVAIKFIAAAMDDRSVMRKRFVREAKMAAKMRSPHIVTIHDFGLDDDIPYLVMELLEGEDLAQRLDREKRLDLETAARIVRDAARGVHQAHDAGVIHRDLKPRNIFIAALGDEHIVKILDFGVAKASWSNGGDTRTGDIVGSPHYMSPEQVHGAKTVDHRTDIWSLGVILFRALTGRRPFRGEGVGQIIVEITTGNPMRASNLVRDLPPAVDRFFARALAREPADRFQTARELATELAQVAGFGESLHDISWPSNVRRQASTPTEPLVLPTPPVEPAEHEDAQTLLNPRGDAPRSGSGSEEIHAAPAPAVAVETPRVNPLPADVMVATHDTSPSAPSFGSLASLQQSLRPPSTATRSVAVAVVISGILVAGVLAVIAMGEAPAPAEQAPAPAAGDTTATEGETIEAPEQGPRATSAVPTTSTNEGSLDSSSSSRAAVNPSRSAAPSRAAASAPVKPPAQPKKDGSGVDRVRLGY